MFVLEKITTNLSNRAIYFTLHNFSGKILKMSDENKGPWGSSKGSSGKGQNGQNSWGNGSSEGPKNINIDETIQKLQDQFKKAFGGKTGGKGGGGSSGSNRPAGDGLSKGTIFLGAFVLAGLWLSSGFFRIQENEMAVVMRFGKVARHASPGLQYHIPYPIESVIKQSSTLQVFEASTRKEMGSDVTPTMILTGDENMVICNYRVRWRIKNITEYLFTARNPESTIRAAAESATREVIGQTLSHLALTTDQDKIAAKVQTSLQGLVDQYKIGVEIREFNMLGVIPPAEVVDSFNDLQASKADASQEINKAESYKNDLLPRTRGAAVQIIQRSEGERDARIAAARGEASLFEQIHAAYEQNRSLAVKRYYLDSMKEVLAKSKVVLFDPKAAQGAVPYLPLNELKAKATDDNISMPADEGAKK